MFVVYSARKIRVTSINLSWSFNDYEDILWVGKITSFPQVVHPGSRFLAKSSNFGPCFVQYLFSISVSLREWVQLRTQFSVVILRCVVTISVSAFRFVGKLQDFVVQKPYKSKYRVYTTVYSIPLTARVTAWGIFIPTQRV